MDYASRLKVQVNDYDSYQAFPLKIDELYYEVEKVPILRIFGVLSVPRSSVSARDENEFYWYNVVLHVHNYYPYLYVHCYDTEESALDNKRLREVVYYLEAALLRSFRECRAENDEDGEETLDDTSEDGAKRKYIADVSICRATPVYGFNSDESLFYKIKCLSPLCKTRLAKLIQQRKIKIPCSNPYLYEMRLSQKVYEAHILYPMQFLTDFNIFSCGLLETEDAYFRQPIFSEESGLDTAVLKDYIQQFIRKDNVLSFSYRRTGKSLLELDITTLSIYNRLYLSSQEFQFTQDSRYNCGNVNLSSLLNVYRDLAYYCDAHRQPVPNSSFVSEDTGRIETSWENQADLSNLLDYAIYLLKNSDQEKRGKLCNSAISKLSTSSNLVDLERRTLSFDRQARLGEGELQHWNSFADLWRDDALESTMTNLSSNRLLSQASDPGQELFQNATVTPFSGERINLDDMNMSFTSNDFSDSESSINLQEEKQEIDEMTQNGYLKDEDLIIRLSQNKACKRFCPGINTSFADSFVSTLSQSHSTPLDMKWLIPENMNNVLEVAKPPELNKDEICRTFELYRMPIVDYTAPFYDKSLDMPKKAFIFSNKKLSIPLKDFSSLDAVKVGFKGSSRSWPMSSLVKKNLSSRKQLTGQGPRLNLQTWEYALQPPLREYIIKWSELQKMKSDDQHSNGLLSTQIQNFDGDSDKYSSSSDNMLRATSKVTNLTNFCLEVHANTENKDTLADPLVDPVNLIFYSYVDSNEMFKNNKFMTGVLIYDESEDRDNKYKFQNMLESSELIEVYNSEILMFQKLINLINYFDPDILSGYEIHTLSWGYLIDRMTLAYNADLLMELSRCVLYANVKHGDRWGYTHTSAYNVSGRHMLNIWRVLRSELSLMSYTLENVCYNVLGCTLPHFLDYQLSKFFKSSRFLERLIVFKYYMKRIQLMLQVIDVQELIVRNVEYSRLIGIDFHSVFYRGSQYKVESILSRLSKLRNFLLDSVSKQAVHEMRPLECVPLVMEPDSSYFKSPLLVLDFQSLYPSIIIAYNYCYTTLMCKLHGFKPGSNTIGYNHDLKISADLLNSLKEQRLLTISPNGYVFVKPLVKKSLLAVMLEELLDARVNIKKAMKIFQHDKNFMKLYNSRQLALKLIANVTYGYTSATFSGRMPNSDIADAIVSTGREILCQSTDIIERLGVGGKVVYGDTDSLFVYLPGKSREEAFDIGKIISEEVTARFPDPIQLKFEKVYHPSFLIAKKRYVGYKYDTPCQSQPTFDAKGIETIRRDGIPAQQKILEKSIRILFETSNLSEVKEYVEKQFIKIIRLDVSINDFCFAKEVKLGTYKSDNSLPPGAIIASKNMSKDHRREPQYRERVPYVVVHDPSKPRMRDRCLSPEDFIVSSKSMGVTLDSDYYIARVLIPPLSRIFNLVGVDISSWYKDLPKVQHEVFGKSSNILKDTIGSLVCLSCGRPLNNKQNETKLCDDCYGNDFEVASSSLFSIRNDLRSLLVIENTCLCCLDRSFPKLGVGVTKSTIDKCVNNDCTVYFRRINAATKYHYRSAKVDEILRSLNW